MSKIICDVCGTTYPETSTQCPICGCVRSVDSNVASGNKGENINGRGTYQPVKGGRFSKSNVQKGNKGVPVPIHNTTTAKTNKEKHKDKTTVGLVITAIVLVLAILAVAIYICLRFFVPDILGAQKPNVPADSTPQQTSGSTEPLVVNCQGVSLDIENIELDTLGDARMLNVTVTPTDTTDVIAFSSSNENVAVVSEDGKVTVIGPGQAVITVSCGNFSDTCVVVCSYVEPTETTAPTTEATEPPVQLSLNRSDITFGKKGESWLLYSGDIEKTKIVWSSDDTSVATIENGKVVAVGGGVTKVHGEYAGQKVSCIIRCDISSGSSNQGVSGNGGGISEDGGSNSGTASGECRLYNPYGSAEDVSIKIGESFSLKLQDSSGNFVSPVWSVGDSECCGVSGNTFTGKKAGTTSVIATYEGKTYTCVVRVRG